LIDKLTQIVHGNHEMRGFPFGDNFLNHKQVIVLFFLSDRINVTSVKEIAKFLHVTPGAVTQLIDGLVDKKLVKREEDLSDRRVINIKLTKITKDRFEDFKKKYFANVSRAFSDFNDIEIEQLIRLINKVKVSEN